MGKGYQGKNDYRKRSRNDEAKEGADGPDNASNERHKGSYPLDELKASDAYINRTEITGPKRKYALCLGYLGSNYKGLQINPDCKSVEAELERALFLCGGIPEYNYGCLQKIQWSRAARTDAGVHAVAQVCAMRLTIPLDQRSDFISLVNKTLPSDITVHAISKVTKAFNSKLYCTKRRYHYLLPTYLMYNQDEVNGYLVEALESPDATTAPFTTYSVTPGQSTIVPQLVGLSLEKIRDKIKSFRVSAEAVERLKGALQRYVGTNNYHNFTSGIASNDAKSNRYIISFDVVGEPFVSEATGVEYILLSVVGQSFLLNQIRKMVAMAVEVARGRATLDTMSVALSAAKVVLTITGMMS
jgi:tRNA pseudouridine38-40 synthase